MAEEKKETTRQEAQVTEEQTLLDDIVQATKLKPADEAYQITKQGVQAFIDELLKPEREGVKVSQALVDEMVAGIDQKLSKQVDAVLHNKDFQKLESAWCSLKFMVDRTDFRENNKIEILNVSKQDLLDDFEDAPEITKSGLYRTCYTQEYGQFGGKPYGLMVGNYEFGPGPQDIKSCGPGPNS
jgi:type VI secretion system protein ImpC